MYGFLTDPKYCYIIMEYVKNGNLDEFFKNYNSQNNNNTTKKEKLSEE